MSRSNHEERAALCGRSQSSSHNRITTKRPYINLSHNVSPECHMNEGVSHTYFHTHTPLYMCIHIHTYILRYIYSLLPGSPFPDAFGPSLQFHGRGKEGRADLLRPLAIDREGAYAAHNYHNTDISYVNISYFEYY